MIKHIVMPDGKPNNTDAMRLDKWLWCARFYKTRSLATEAIKSGKIKSRGSRVKPSRLVRPGEEYTVRRGPYSQTITVLSLAARRCSAAEAAALYEETRESIDNRLMLKQQLKINNSMYPRMRGRPTKRERRKLIQFTRDSGQGSEGT
jgi:ribosome-associated heat shock protein Hsp15